MCNDAYIPDDNRENQQDADMAGCEEWMAESIEFEAFYAANVEANFNAGPIYDAADTAAHEQFAAIPF